MTGIITRMERKVLIDRVMKQRETDGIKNQILHLEIPDDNEQYENVFYWLEDHILEQIAEWTKILRELHKFKRRMW
jgi:hypothetical protein